MEYFQYFRLKGPPFQPASPDGAVYFSPTHLEGLATLEAGLTRELSGLTLLTGEAGTGKTTLIYSLLKRDYKRVRIAHIDDPKLSFLEIMQLILKQMNLYSAGTTKLDYLNTLDHLLELHGNDERIAIIIDESQVLSDDVLEELRLLSNRGQHNDRRLQLILVGQPELAERLKKPELRQLNQRISSRGVLKALTVEQATMYVECKLSAQGGSCAALFEPRALTHLLRHSDGIPRKINVLCHTAMQAAFYASEKKVSFKTARRIAAEFEESVSARNRRARIRALVTPVLAGGVAFGALVLLSFIYPNPWAKWVLSHSRAFRSTQEIRPAIQPEPSNGRKLSHVKEKPGVAAKSQAATATAASHPGESRAPLASSSRQNVVAAATPAAQKTSANPAATIGALANAGTPQRIAADGTSERRDQITVEYGDTLEKLAFRYFGSEAGINKLIAANPQITNINDLAVGQIIYLPPGIGAKIPANQTAAARAVSSARDPSE